MAHLLGKQAKTPGQKRINGNNVTSYQQKENCRQTRRKHKN
jgi:hypothetical protein